jgi:hypothetical protein
MPTPQELAAMLQQARPAIPVAPSIPVPTAGQITAAQKEAERRQKLRDSAKAAYGLTDEQYDEFLRNINNAKSQ